jgi:hypothetical protein
MVGGISFYRFELHYLFVCSTTCRDGPDQVVSATDISFAGHLQTVQEGIEPFDPELGDVASRNDQAIFQENQEIEVENDARVTR